MSPLNVIFPGGDWKFTQIFYILYKTLDRSCHFLLQMGLNHSATINLRLMVADANHFDCWTHHEVFCEDTCSTWHQILVQGTGVTCSQIFSYSTIHAWRVPTSPVDTVVNLILYQQSDMDNDNDSI